MGREENVGIREDCRLIEEYLHALPNDDKTRDATITLLQFEKWGLIFRALAIFEDQEIISRKVLARYSDVFEKQFSSLGANRDRIRRYIEEAMI